MQPRLPHGPNEAKRQLVRARRPHLHEDAAASMIGRDAESIARDLGLAGRTVRQWRERYQTHHRGPGRTLFLAMRSALDLGRDERDALAPLYALCEEFGLEVAPAGTDRYAGTPTEASAAILKEAGESVATFIDSVSDGVITPEEAEVNERQLQQAHDAIENARQLNRQKARQWGAA